MDIDHKKEAGMLDYMKTFVQAATNNIVNMERRTTMPTKQPTAYKSCVYRLDFQRVVDKTTHIFSFTLCDADIEDLVVSELIKSKKDNNAKVIFSTSLIESQKMKEGELQMQFSVGSSKFSNEAFKRMKVTHLLSYAVNETVSVNVILESTPTLGDDAVDHWA